MTRDPPVPDMVAHACSNPSIWEVQAEELLGGLKIAQTTK